MSVLVLDIPVFESIYQKAWLYGFNKQVDVNYCHALSFDNEDDLKDHVKNWITLNELSFNRRYDEKNEPFLVNFMKFRHGAKISTYQMLKYLQCLQYNIELDTIRNGKTGFEPKMIITSELMESYKLLERAILEIMQQCINEIPQYKNANWSDI